MHLFIYLLIRGYLLHRNHKSHLDGSRKESHFSISDRRARSNIGMLFTMTVVVGVVHSGNQSKLQPRHVMKRIAGRAAARSIIRLAMFS